MELNYKSFGQGDPLIILHGVFGMLDNWQTLGKRFAEHFTVLLVDQRNHGRSPHHPDFNYRLLAEDLHEFMESHWVYKAHFIGHSMGGKTAMQFAFDYPDIVDKLVVADISPKAYPYRHTHIFDALESLDLNRLGGREEAEQHLRTYLDDESEVQFLLKNLSRDKEGGFRLKMNLPALRAHYDDILAPVHSAVPFDGDTLFVRGGNSNHIPDSDWPLIQTLFPKAILKTIPNAGHWLHADQPEAFYDTVMDFLKV